MIRPRKTNYLKYNVSYFSTGKIPIHKSKIICPATKVIYNIVREVAILAIDDTTAANVSTTGAS